MSRTTILALVVGLGVSLAVALGTGAFLEHTDTGQAITWDAIALAEG